MTATRSAAKPHDGQIDLIDTSDPLITLPITCTPPTRVSKMQTPDTSRHFIFLKTKVHYMSCYRRLYIQRYCSVL